MKENTLFICVYCFLIKGKKLLGQPDKSEANSLLRSSSLYLPWR